jgi:hypothetical protein
VLTLVQHKGNTILDIKVVYRRDEPPFSASDRRTKVA